MAQKFKEGALTPTEKKITKKLLNKGWRGQDILALLNIGRERTTNSGRITAVKQDKNQTECSDSELNRYTQIQQAYDLRTGLNPFKDERLYRAREAMILAVQVFNSPAHKFKSEVFCILSNIAWTYLCHERLLRKNVKVTGKNGKNLALSEMWGKPELKLSNAVIANLSDIKELRDKVEHHILNAADSLWSGLFQANCLNFNKTMCDWFGEKLTLQNELSFSIQFAKMNLEDLSLINKYEIPEDLKAFNAELKSKHSGEIRDNIEYEFAVIYTMVPGSKSKSHIQFLSPESAEGKEVSNVLIKHKPADELYPYKPQKVCV